MFAESMLPEGLRPPVDSVYGEVLLGFIAGAVVFWIVMTLLGRR